AGRRDAWRFLTPEVEREVPALVAALDPAADAPRVEEALDALVREGDEERWFAYLRGCRATLERAVARGADGAAARRLALALLEQYLLAPSLRELDARDRDEERRLRLLAA